MVADPGECSFQFNVVGTSQFTSSCDIAKSLLAGKGVGYKNEVAPAGSLAKIRIGNETIQSVDAVSGGENAKSQVNAFARAVTDALHASNYPTAAEPAKMNRPMMLVVLVVLVIYGTMVFGPMAAQLVELFPTRIRYSGVSLPYHIGNGWFGGLLPTTAFAIVAATGDMYSGLWYPIVIAGVTFIVSLLFMPETKDRDIFSDSSEV